MNTMHTKYINLQFTIVIVNSAGSHVCPKIKKKKSMNTTTVINCTCVQGITHSDTIITHLVSVEG